MSSRPVRRYRSLVFQSYLLASILAFAVLAFLANTYAYFPVDVLIPKLLQSHHSPWLDVIMLAVSWPGYSLPATLVTLIPFMLLVFLILYREGFALVLGVISSSALNLLVKIVVHRPRPSDVDDGPSSR